LLPALNDKLIDRDRLVTSRALQGFFILAGWAIMVGIAFKEMSEEH
jgi:hypothetical protein